MKHAPKTEFKHSPTPASAPALSMREAMAQAKAAVADMTGLDADSVAQCRKDDSGVWSVTVDVIESMARMGDNDLLAAYEVQIDTEGELVQFNRLRRYHREDQES